MEKCIDLLREQGYDLFANWAVFPRNGEFTFFGSVLLLSNIGSCHQTCQSRKSIQKSGI